MFQCSQNPKPIAVVSIVPKVLTVRTKIGLVFSSAGFCVVILGNELGFGMIRLNHELAISGVMAFWPEAKARTSLIDNRHCFYLKVRLYPRYGNPR